MFEGRLCVNVFKSLRGIDNDTSLDVVMRGLLPPELKNIAETRATDAARELCAGNTDIAFQRKISFQGVLKDVEFLVALTKKGKISNNFLSKFECYEELRLNIEEFEEAKLRADTIEEEEKEEKDKAKTENKSETSKKSKKKERKKSLHKIK